MTAKRQHPRQQKQRADKVTKKRKIQGNKTKKVKRQVFEESSEDDIINSDDLCDDNSEVNDGTELCFICIDVGKDGELWFRCVHCS